MEANEYITVKEALAMLKVSRQTLYNQINSGKLRVWRNPLYARRGPVKLVRADVEALRLQIEAARPQ